MALDLKEQEELEDVKRAWHTWGKWVFYTFLVIALFYLFNGIWTRHQNSKNDEAYNLQMQYETQINTGNLDQALETVKILQSKYSKSYASSLVTFKLAYEAFQAKKYDEAYNHYMWIKNNNKDPLIQFFAISRMATVKLQLKQYDQALKLLDEPINEHFQSQVWNLKGDVLREQGKREEAIKAYDEALKRAPKNNSDFIDLINLKKAI